MRTPRLTTAMSRQTSRVGFLLTTALACSVVSFAAEPKPKPQPRPLPTFERVVIDDNFPGAYQVEVADVNGDRKPDVVALGGGTCAWYENPNWKKRIVSTPKQTPGIISTATADLDGDGKAEIAIAYEFAMNQPTKGKLLLAHPGKSLDDPWELVPVADVPSIHRLRWLRREVRSEFTAPPDRPATKSQPSKLIHILKHTDLVVAPIFGPSATPPRFAEEPAHLLLFRVQTGEDHRPSVFLGGDGGTIGGGNRSIRDPAADRKEPQAAVSKASDVEGSKTSEKTGQKPRLSATGERFGDAPVLHAIDVVDLYGDPMKAGTKVPVVLGASNLGVTEYSWPAMTSGMLLHSYRNLVPGAAGETPKKGASEVHVGRLSDGRKFLATVEPWHGTDVAVYVAEKAEQLKFGSRTVIDATLKDGHALWVADVDGDGDDEVFAGYRGKGTSLIGYDFDGKTWNRTVIDTAIAAQDLRGGDIDGDGTPDFVGVGGATHNVVWYRTRKE